jgi:hypothetical protein
MRLAMLGFALRLNQQSMISHLSDSEKQVCENDIVLRGGLVKMYYFASFLSHFFVDRNSVFAYNSQ